MHWTQSYMELIGPKQQTVWRWPAVWNFALGGAGAGFYLISSWSGMFGPGGMLHESWRLVGLALIGLGFVAVSFEAGRPLRSRFILGNLKRSWMSREALAAACLFPVALFAWLMPHPIWSGLGLCLAAAFLACQGFIIYASRGVTAWNVPWIPPLFFVSGLVSGAGVSLVLLLFAGRIPNPLATTVLTLVLVGVILEGALWLFYVWGSRDPELSHALTQVRSRRFFVGYLVTLRFVPAALLLLSSWAVVPPAGHWTHRWLIVVIGLALFAGGVRQKSGIVLRAGNLRPIRLHQSPPMDLSRQPAGDQPKAGSGSAANQKEAASSKRIALRIKP